MYLLRVAGIGLALACSANAFYLPGAAPRDYREGDKGELGVNAWTPMLAGTDDAKLVSQPISETTNYF